MYIQPNHILSRTNLRLSPNRSERPVLTAVDLVVIHCISLPEGSANTDHIHALFANELDVAADPSFHDLAGVHVSAHALIDRRGKVTQYVPFNQQAWHAGVSSWRGRLGCNRYSVGLELVGTDQGTYTSAQYKKLARVLSALFERYPGLSLSAVVGHEEIAPDRKTDPGPGFDWRRLYSALGQSFGKK